MPSSTAFLPTEVAQSGLTALIQNLGRDCLPSQFLREFVKNALEACQRTGLDGRSVIVDYNKSVFENDGVHKICFIDNGDGMTDSQMLSLLNNLSASGDVRNQHTNYGVGAKISALTRNHAGIFYESWRNGVGHAITIEYNERDGVYGIVGVPRDDGKVLYCIPLSGGRKPDGISENGTRVTLFGNANEQDTMCPPEGVSGIRESWISLYLNSRFFRFPEKIQVSARIGYYRDASNSRHHYLHRVFGQKYSLDSKAAIKGEVSLSDANLYWWVMPKNCDGHGRELLKGHTALINQDEIFDVSDARSSRIVHFGVIFGRDRVIIYVEPKNAVQNTARTNLLKRDGSAICWDNWQDEFRESMPAELKKFLDQLQSENDSESNTDAIRDRLKHIRDLYKLSRYRAHVDGQVIADPSSEAPFDTGHNRSSDTPIDATSASQKGNRSGSLATSLLTALATESGGVASVVVSPDPFPRVHWVKASDEHQALTDRAAEYVGSQNLILANSEFQGISDLVKFISKDYKELPEVIQVIESEVRSAYEQALTECVAGALSLKNREHWKPQEWERAVSPESLTVAVMQKYWMISSIKRALAARVRGYLSNSPES